MKLTFRNPITLSRYHSLNKGIPSSKYAASDIQNAQMVNPTLLGRLISFEKTLSISV